MNDKIDELHLIYKMIGNYGFCTVQELLNTYEKLQEENQQLKEQLSNGHQIKNQQKEIINIIENKFLESTLESYVCIKIEDYLKLKNILYR